MPRHGQRTAEETGEAGSEAFKGAVVGAAKVGSSDRAPTRCRPWTLPLSSLSLLTNTIHGVVGSHCRWAWCRWLLPLPHL